MATRLLDQAAQLLHLVGVVTPHGRRHRNRLLAIGPPPDEVDVIGHGDHGLVPAHAGGAHAVRPEAQVGQPERDIGPVRQGPFDQLQLAVQLLRYALVPYDFAGGAPDLISLPRLSMDPLPVPPVSAAVTTGAALPAVDVASPGPGEEPPFNVLPMVAAPASSPDPAAERRRRAPREPGEGRTGQPPWPGQPTRR